MEEALKTVLESVDLDETLVIVTADHSHAVTMNGYPEVRRCTESLIKVFPRLRDFAPAPRRNLGYTFLWTLYI